MKFNQTKLEVHDSYKKDEKPTKHSETTKDIDVINRGYLDGKLIKLNDHLSLVEKNNQIKIQYNKESVEETSIQRAVKTTLQILCDKGLLDNFPNSDKVFKVFLFITRR